MSTETEKLRGAALLLAAIEHIITHPESWDQAVIWHDGDRHCLFGWCQIIAGLSPDADYCFEEVRDLLGLCTPDAAWLCAPSRTMDQIRWFADELAAGRITMTGRDCEGYDAEGYDRFGYDRFGFDRQGRRAPWLCTYSCVQL